MMEFMGKFSVKPIITEHLKTFKKVDGDYIIKDLSVLLGVPLVFIIVFALVFSEGLPDIFVNSLLTVFTILTPLLFALLPLVFSLIENKKVSSSGRISLKEFKANILFTILLSFIFLIVLLFCSLGYLRFWLSLGVYFLFVEVVLHLCLIIQRFNILMDSFISLQNKFR